MNNVITNLSVVVESSMNWWKRYSVVLSGFGIFLIIRVVGKNRPFDTFVNDFWFWLFVFFSAKTAVRRGNERSKNFLDTKVSQTFTPPVVDGLIIVRTYWGRVKAGRGQKVKISRKKWLSSIGFCSMTQVGVPPPPPPPLSNLDGRPVHHRVSCIKWLHRKRTINW